MSVLGVEPGSFGRADSPAVSPAPTHCFLNRFHIVFYNQPYFNPGKEFTKIKKDQLRDEEYCQHSEGEGDFGVSALEEIGALYRLNSCM